MTKPIKITDERAIDAAKDFNQARKQLQKDFALLQLKQARETEEMMAHWKKTFRGLFRIATEGVLDDPDEAFSKNTHVLDLSYVDYGDVYLIQRPQENSKKEEDEETSGEFIPSRIVVN